MEHDNGVGPRESPAQRVAASLEEMPRVPPVNPALEHQFAKLLEDEHSPQHEREPQSEHGDASPGPDTLKQRGFRFVEKMIMSHAFIRPGNDTQQKQCDGMQADDIEKQEARATAPGSVSINASMLRFGTALLDDGAASDLSNELAECIRGTASFGLPWQAEVTLSNKALPETRLLIAADHAVLHLRFFSADSGACSMLREHRDFLTTRLSQVSERPVVIDIDAISQPDPGHPYMGGAA